MTRRRTRHAHAGHEAAHVVVGVHAGLHLDRVVLRDNPKDESVGYTMFYEIPGDRKLAAALCDAAGPAYESMVGNRRRKYNATFDLEALREEGWSDHDIKLLIGIARTYLEGPGRVAHELITRALEERDLTGDEVQEILDGRE